MFGFVESNANVAKVGAVFLPRDEAAVIDKVFADRVNDDALIRDRETERRRGERIDWQGLEVGWHQLFERLGQSSGV